VLSSVAGSTRNMAWTNVNNGCTIHIGARTTFGLRLSDDATQLGPRTNVLSVFIIHTTKERRTPRSAGLLSIFAVVIEDVRPMCQSYCAIDSAELSNGSVGTRYVNGLRAYTEPTDAVQPAMLPVRSLYNHRLFLCRRRLVMRSTENARR